MTQTERKQLLGLAGRFAAAAIAEGARRDYTPVMIAHEAVTTALAVFNDERLKAVGKS